MTLIDFIIVTIILILIPNLIGGLLISYFSSKKYYKFKDGSKKVYQCTEKSILVNCNIIPLNTAFFNSYTLLDVGDNIYLVEKNYNKKQLKPGDIVLHKTSYGFSMCEIIKEVGDGKFTVEELDCDFSKRLNYIIYHYTITTTDLIGKIIKDKRVRYI